MIIQEQLQEFLSADQVRVNEPMSEHTTFRVGGPAQFFVEPHTEEQAIRVAQLCHEANLPLYVLGCGSNVLVADAGLQGVVMHIGPKMGAIEVHNDNTITAAAGAKNALIARAALNAGLAGFEFAAGIPGSIGGAAIMNAGAYGGELRDVATQVTCFNQQGSVMVVPASEAGWGYRCSRFADDGLIVLSVTIALQPGNTEEITALMADFAGRRGQKQPLDLPSAGSTFKRPEGYFAGKLIQDAGMQGYSVGGAQVSPKHAGFVVNNGTATAADILQVIQDVQAAVLQQFNVKLQTEVRMWGF